MVGAAAESIVLRVRSALVAKLDELGEKKPKDLTDWRISRILKAIQQVVESKKSSIPASVFGSFDAYWPAFTYQIRSVRNESGHPTTIEPIESETVHASLLVFPELASIGSKLEHWICAGFQ